MEMRGSFINRLMENAECKSEITVGMGVTEFLYSDRHAWEVIEVRDQRHVTIRLLDHEHEGDGEMDNRWVLISNEANPTRDLVKRGKYWYAENVITADVLDGEWTWEKALWLAHNDVTPEALKEKGKIRRYHRMDVSFGWADYYYDYEF